jgi:hypothetical protein
MHNLLKALQPGSQSYDRELQRQRCKKLQSHEQPSAFSKQKYFLLPTLKNALSNYNADMYVEVRVQPDLSWVVQLLKHFLLLLQTS